MAVLPKVPQVMFLGAGPYKAAWSLDGPAEGRGEEDGVEEGAVGADEEHAGLFGKTGITFRSVVWFG